MPISLAYRLTRKILSAVATIARRDVSSDAELLVLRHENTVLRRQVKKVCYQPEDRLWLAALTKRPLESALDGEITDHLGYAKHDGAGDGSGNSRKGRRSKTVLTDIGPVQIEVSRDRASRHRRQASTGGPSLNPSWSRWHRPPSQTRHGGFNRWLQHRCVGLRVGAR